MTPSKVLAACALALFAFTPLTAPFGGVARAQLLLRPPADVPDAVFEPAQGMDAAGAQLRIDRLENQMRGMTGQIEQMQFQIKRLEEQLRKFQQDVDFRFDELKTAKPAARPAPAAPAPAAPAAPARRTELNENGYPVLAQRAAPAEPLPVAAPTSGSADLRGAVATLSIPRSTRWPPAPRVIWRPWRPAPTPPRRCQAPAPQLCPLDRWSPQMRPISTPPSISPASLRLPLLRCALRASIPPRPPVCRARPLPPQR